VLDHFAMVPANTPHDDKRLQTLLELMGGGNVYVKLSAPYRIAQTDCVAAAAHLAQTFVDLYPERVLWGSDWPHTNREPGKTAHEVSAYRYIPSATLSESIQSWLPTASLREQVLVINPERLYDF
jgi:predicted TIM-barrel fold metal-dependent hydrolase